MTEIWTRIDGVPSLLAVMDAEPLMGDVLTVGGERWIVGRREWTADDRLRVLVTRDAWRGAWWDETKPEAEDGQEVLL